MSLVGNLEDLGLGDILQIVSLSRKSGVLVLSSREREGRIVFRAGQVIHATSSVFRENLGDLLMREKLVDLGTLKKALFIQRNSERRQRIGAILIDKFDVPAERIDALAREQIEKIVYSFFAWDEGSFSFELGQPDDLATTSFSPLQFMLEQGLNPQWLAMEGTRILDEKRHRGESLEDEAREPVLDVDSLLDAPPASPVPGPPAGSALAETLPETSEPGALGGDSLYLVDDDAQLRQALCGLLQERGLAVRAFARGEELLEALAGVAEEERPVVLVDLIMPRLDGSGILGGLELAEVIRRRHPELELQLMADHASSEAEQRARELGLREILAKPRRNELRAPQGQRMLAVLGDLLAGRVQDRADASHFNLGAELFRELGVEGGREPSREAEEAGTPGLHLLRGMLQELNDPALGGGIILLVLRFASELMNRAVVFFVKDREVTGLGQFGIEIPGESADARVRRIKVPIHEPSLFREVVEARCAVRIAVGDSPWDTYLCEQLGGQRPQEVFLGPIVSEGKIVAILYGDNLPEKRPVGETEALEIFLSQAGLAMEKALLERRLHGRDGR